MKKIILSIVIMLTAIVATAQMDIPPVGFNPRATISEEVGITSISINYSRPGVKGREGKIWGGVVANVNQYIAYGRTLITQKRIDRALDIMLAAQIKFGDVYAVNNGFSYAYSANAGYTKAIEFANKALAQATSPQAKATVTANIEKLKAGKDIN